MLTLFLIPNNKSNPNYVKLPYLKYLITKKAPSIEQQIYTINPKVKLTSNMLGEITKALLIGSNHKFNIIKNIYNEISYDENSILNFDLMMIKAMLADLNGDINAESLFQKAEKIARSNTELYVCAYFRKASNLEDIKEDLDYIQIDESNKMIEEFSAIKKKLEKLKV